MKFSRSLKLNHVFRRLYSKGSCVAGRAERISAGRYLVLYCKRNGSNENRVGITVSKKLGGAVVRNRARRRLRECYRLNEDRLRPGYDIVIAARSRCLSAPFAVLEASFLSACSSLGLTREPEDRT